MPRELTAPITYLVTSGETTSATTPSSEDFQALLSLVERAASARVSLVQLREKSLSARTLYELAARAARITRGTPTRLLVNDRADIARAALCDGVQLTARSLAASVVRRAFGPDFIVGVSTHTLREAREARDRGADFAVFGPVFDTPSKRAYGPPLALKLLAPAAAPPLAVMRRAEAARVPAPSPLAAGGGVGKETPGEVPDAGAGGAAAI